MTIFYINQKHKKGMNMKKTILACIMGFTLSYASSAYANRPCTGKDVYGDKKEWIAYGVITGLSGDDEDANIDLHVTSDIPVKKRDFHYSLNDSVYKYQLGKVAIEVGDGWSKPLPNRQVTIWGYDGTSCYYTANMKP